MKTLLFLLMANIFIACNSSDSTTQSVKMQAAIARNLDTVGLNYKPLKYFKGDTVAYLKENFEKKKKYFVNKPFNLIWDLLEVKDNSFLTQDSTYNNVKPVVRKPLVLFDKNMHPSRAITDIRYRNYYLNISFHQAFKDKEIGYGVNGNKSYFLISTEYYEILKDKKVSDISVSEFRCWNQDTKKQSTKTDVTIVQNLDTVGLNYKLLKQFKGDTVAYLKENFEKKKKYFINKPCHFILDLLEVKDYRFFFLDTTYYNAKPGNVSDLAFYDAHKPSAKPSMKDTGKKRYFFYISFEPLFYAKEIITANKGNTKYFTVTPEVYEVLKDKNVSNISVSEYHVK